MQFIILVHKKMYIEVCILRSVSVVCLSLICHIIDCYNKAGKGNKVLQVLDTKFDLNAERHFFSMFQPISLSMGSFKIAVFLCIYIDTSLSVMSLQRNIFLFLVVSPWDGNCLLNETVTNLCLQCTKCNFPTHRELQNRCYTSTALAHVIASAT